MYSLLDLIDDEKLPPIRRKRPQRVPRPTSFSYIRQIRDGLFQARPWLGVRWIGSVNLGLYRSERDAHRAVVEWVKAGADPCRGLPAKVLPKFVRRHPGGGYFGRVRKRGRVHETELCETAEGAHTAMVDRLNELFPRRRSAVVRQSTLLDLLDLLAVG